MVFPVDQERREAAEHELGQPLPGDLRAQLRDDNGGEIVAELLDRAAGDFDPDWELYPVWDDTDRRRTARTASHIVHETREARASPRFPTDAIAIAGNGTGDRLILQDDALAWWDHETGETHDVRVRWDP